MSLTANVLGNNTRGNHATLDSEGEALSTATFSLRLFGSHKFGTCLLETLGPLEK